MPSPSFFFLLWWMFWVVLDKFFDFIAPIYDHISISTYVYIIGVIVSYSVGGLIARARFFHFSFKLRMFFGKFFLFSGPKKWIFILFALLLLSSVERLLVIGPTFLTPSSINDYRVLITVDGEDRMFGFLTLFNPLIFLTGVFLVYNYENFSNLSKLFIFIPSIIIVYLAASRSFAVVYMLNFFFAYLLCRRMPINIIAFYGFIFIIIFIGIGSIFGKTYMDLIYYYFGPVHAFDALFSNKITFPENFDILSFRFLHGIFFKFNLIDNPAIMLPYVNISPIINVYSALHTFWYDFGYSSFFIYIFFGFIADSIYYWNKSTSTFRSFAMLVNVYSCIVLSVFFDYFTSAGFVYMTVIFLIICSFEDRSFFRSAR